VPIGTVLTARLHFWRAFVPVRLSFSNGSSLENPYIYDFWLAMSDSDSLSEYLGWFSFVDLGRDLLIYFVCESSRT